MDGHFMSNNKDCYAPITLLNDAPIMTFVSFANIFGSVNADGYISAPHPDKIGRLTQCLNSFMIARHSSVLMEKLPPLDIEVLKFEYPSDTAATIATWFERWTKAMNAQVNSAPKLATFPVASLRGRGQG